MKQQAVAASRSQAGWPQAGRDHGWMESDSLANA